MTLEKAVKICAIDEYHDIFGH